MENTAIKLVEQIVELKEDDVTRPAVLRQEKIQIGEYNTTKREISMLQKQQLEKEKQKTMEIRSLKEFSKTGKHDMHRSEKIKIKKEKKKDVVD